MISFLASTKDNFRCLQQYLYQTEHYCSNKAECRRVQLLRYFGEVFDRKYCIENYRSVCDNCLLKVVILSFLSIDSLCDLITIFYQQNEYENVDITDEVKSILKSVEILVGPYGQKRKENIGFPQLIKIYNGIEVN